MRALVLDIGSSSVKAGLYDGRARRCVATARAEFPTRFEGPCAEVDARHLLRSMWRAGREALAGRRADAVVYCTFSSGVVVTSRTFEPRTPVILHSDRRSTENARALVEAAGKRWWLRHTGNLPYPGGIGASTLAWLVRHQPGRFRRGYRCGQVASLVGERLTGQWVTDPSQAVFLGLWDIRREGWSAEACRMVGVDAGALPRVQWADSVQGGLTAEAGRAWDLPTGTPVMGGLVDTSAGIIQAPLRPGQLTHNAGSTDVLAMTLERPRPAEGILTRPVGVGCVYPRAWLAVRTMAAAGSAIAWAHENLFGDVAPRAWEAMLGRAAALDTGGVTCVPAFAGERAAIEQGSGAVFGGVRLSTSRRELLAALVQGLVRRSRENYEILRGIHVPRREVFGMGGADALGRAMHAAWPGGHRFRALTGDSLRGLGELAQRVAGEG